MTAKQCSRPANALININNVDWGMEIRYQCINHLKFITRIGKENLSPSTNTLIWWIPSSFVADSSVPTDGTYRNNTASVSLSCINTVRGILRYNEELTMHLMILNRLCRYRSKGAKTNMQGYKLELSPLALFFLKALV